MINVLDVLPDLFTELAWRIGRLALLARHRSHGPMHRNDFFGWSVGLEVQAVNVLGEQSGQQALVVTDAADSSGGGIRESRSYSRIRCIYSPQARLTRQRRGAPSRDLSCVSKVPSATQHIA